MKPTTIHSPADARLEPFRNVKGQGPRPDGTFVGESEMVLERMFASSMTVRSILIAPARAERLRDILATYVDRQPTAVEVLVADRHLIDEVIGYPLHRGVIVVAERPEPVPVAQILSSARTLVVLEGVMDPDNVGTVFRHAAGFGVDAVLLLGATGDPLYRKSIRTSMGWTLSIPYARGLRDDVLGQLRDHEFTTLALTPDRSAEVLADTITTIEPTRKLALLLGAEGPGLTDEAMRLADHRVRIPLSEGVDSLNVSTAGAIALYALTVAQPTRLVGRSGI